MSTEQLRILIGQKIREERIARHMSIDELSELLGITPGFLGLMERGSRGTTPLTLYKLSNVFGMPIDSLFLKANDSLPMEDAKKGMAKKLESMVSNLSEAELDFIVEIIKAFRKLNDSQ